MLFKFLASSQAQICVRNQISISGNTHSILIDGENGHEITYTEDNEEPLYASGYAGLRTWDGDVSFDDIKVEPN